MDRAEDILTYHEATKHHFHRYARSAGYMDWRNQPNPFRIYDGAPAVPLKVVQGDLTVSLDAVQSGRPIHGQPLNWTAVSRLLSHSMALSAWKATGGSRWSLRINPSSGNLHPTECYLLLPEVEAVADGVYHYNAFNHCLTRRAAMPDNFAEEWESYFGAAGFALALSSIPWRESWKYGERAFRYCQLDAGHALAAISYGARLNGWRVTCLSGAGDDQIDALLGFDRTRWHPRETEHADLICWVSTDPSPDPIPRDLPDRLVTPFFHLAIDGRPNQLSAKAMQWSIIDEAAAAVRKDKTTPLSSQSISQRPDYPLPKHVDLARIICRRRSAVAYDPGRSVSKTDFYAMLDSTRPRRDVPPFDAAPFGPMVDLLLFVHRVEELSPGCYLFHRSLLPLAELKAMCDENLLWLRVQDDLPLYRLRDGDATYDAMEVSCHQEIAGHSTFALAMLTPLNSVVLDKPYLYRHLHWECGMIGQALYLGAEACGIRGTGIGCFFDDAVAELIGIKNSSLQSLYHFTVGHPVEDHRLQTLPAYHHLAR